MLEFEVDRPQSKVNWGKHGEDRGGGDWEDSRIWARWCESRCFGIEVDTVTSIKRDQNLDLKPWLTMYMQVTLLIHWSMLTLYLSCLCISSVAVVHVSLPCSIAVHTQPSHINCLKETINQWIKKSYWSINQIHSVQIKK